MSIVQFLMKENVNTNVELSHLTLLAIIDNFSHIIREIIRYLCPIWKWQPLEKNILLLNHAV